MNVPSFQNRIWKNGQIDVNFKARDIIRMMHESAFKQFYKLIIFEPFVNLESIYFVKV